MNSFKCIGFFFLFATSVSTTVIANDGLETRVDVSAQAVFSPVIVRGLANPAVASYERLLRGAASYVANHGLAPNSEFRFKAYDRSEAKTPMSLRYEGDGKIVAIDVDANGYFTLPGEAEIGSREGELVSNRRTGELQIVPTIETPGFSRGQKRLGDNRLWCAVSWAMDKDDAPLKIKLLASFTNGPCMNSRVHIVQSYLRGTVKKVELAEGGKRQGLQVERSKNGFVVPLHDTNWSNDATLTVTFDDDDASPSADFKNR